MDLSNPQMGELEKPVWKCKSCGYCCSWSVFRYSNNEVNREFLSARGFRLEFIKEGIDAYLRNSCPHLRSKANKFYCDIYKTRPAACREADCPKEDKIK